VLLRDRDLAGLPLLTQPVQVGQHDVLEDRLDGVGGEEPVERGVGSLLIQPVQRRRKLAGLVTQDGGRRRDRPRCWFAAAEGQTGRLGGGESVGHEALHALDPGFVGSAVQPKAACGPRRLEESVPLLPRPEQLGTDSGSFRQLTDPQVARFGIGRALVAFLFVHGRTVQAEDYLCTDS
jgi:hypothetical protein